ncbi:unnamed protein product [Clavelina lepadiformis]|uniref:Uncharacterized protein n=1 Tax=Clavelina lepadiformis TaxID=159417 RepID=A0ABP0GSX6_CLALP
MNALVAMLVLMCALAIIQADSRTSEKTSTVTKEDKNKDKLKALVKVDCSNICLRNSKTQKYLKKCSEVTKKIKCWFCRWIFKCSQNLSRIL